MRTTPVLERSSVRIDVVDPPKRLVHCVDKTGSKFMASYVLTPTSFQIPVPGEYWAITRHGWQWHLDHRFDQPGESFKETLSAGDVHIRTPGNVYMDAGVLNMGTGSVSPTTRESKVISGTPATYTLSGVPVHPYSVMVYVNGAFLHPDLDWSISSSVITFASSLSNADKLTVYYQRSSNEYLDSDVVTSFVHFYDTLDEFA